MQQVILHDVADRAGFFIKRSAALHAERFGHRDLHAARRSCDSRSAPETNWRSGKRAGSAPAPCPGSGRCERSTFRRSSTQQNALSFCAEAKIAAKRLFDDDAGPLGTAGAAQLLDDRPETTRAEWPDSGPDARPCRVACAVSSNVASVVVVAVDVPQERAQLVECLRIDAAAVLLQTRLGAVLQIVERPIVLGDAHHGHVQMAALDHRLQRGKDLLVGQIARGSEEHQGVGVDGALIVVLCVQRGSATVGQWLRCGYLPAGFSTCPPNSNRMADSSLSAKSPSPRELKALVERRTQHRHGHAFVDGRLDRPAAFARIGNASGKFRQLRVFQQRRGRQIQQPGADHAAAPPDFGHVGQIEIVLVVLRDCAAAWFRRRRCGRACRCWPVRALPVLRHRRP